MAFDLVSHAYVINLPKIPKGWGLESPWGGEQVEIWGAWHAQGGQRSSTSFSHFALCVFSIRLFLNYILL